MKHFVLKKMRHLANTRFYLCVFVNCLCAWLSRWLAIGTYTMIPNMHRKINIDVCWNIYVWSIETHHVLWDRKRESHITLTGLLYARNGAPPPQNVLICFLLLFYFNNLSILEGVYFINADIWLIHAQCQKIIGTQKANNVTLREWNPLCSNLTWIL